MGDFCAAEKHFFVETGFAFIFSLGMKMESKRPQNPMLSTRSLACVTAASPWTQTLPAHASKNISIV